MNLKPININGYDTYFTESTDDRGPFFLIAVPRNAPKNVFSNITGTFFDSKLITYTTYIVSEDGTHFMKAYY